MHLCGDELSSIGLVKSSYSLFDIIYNFLTFEVSNLPLFSIVFSLWYKIMPFGEVFLRILPIIIMDIGLYYYIKLLSKISNKCIALIGLVLMTFSNYFMLNFTFLRSYCLLFTLSISTLFMYIALEENKSKSNRIKYTISLFLLIFTHYYGTIIGIALFFIDVLKYIKKKNSLKDFIPYFVFIIFAIWFILVFALKTQKIELLESNYGDFNGFILILKELFSQNVVMIALFFISTFYIIINYIKHRNKDGEPFVIMIILIILSFIVAYTYKYIFNMENSYIFSRYFIGVYPYIIAVLVYGQNLIVKNSFLNKNTYLKTGFLVFYTIMFIVYSKNCYNYINWNLKNDNIEHYMHKQATIDILNKISYDEKAVIMVDIPQVEIDGWKDYYFKHDGRNFNIEIINYDKYESENDILKYDVIYDVRCLYYRENKEALNVINDNYSVTHVSKIVDKYEKK